MTVNELIAKLQALPAEVRRLDIVTYNRGDGEYEDAEVVVPIRLDPLQMVSVNGDANAVAIS